MLCRFTVTGVAVSLTWILKEIRLWCLSQDSEVEQSNNIFELGVTVTLITCHMFCFTFISSFNHHNNPMGKLRHREVKWPAETCKWSRWASVPYTAIFSFCIIVEDSESYNPFDKLPEASWDSRADCVFRSVLFSLLLHRERNEWNQVLLSCPVSTLLLGTFLSCLHVLVPMASKSIGFKPHTYIHTCFRMHANSHTYIDMHICTHICTHPCIDTRTYT